MTCTIWEDKTVPIHEAWIEVKRSCDIDTNLKELCASCTVEGRFILNYKCDQKPTPSDRKLPLGPEVRCGGVNGSVCKFNVV